MSWRCSRRTWTAQYLTSRMSVCCWHHRRGTVRELGSSGSCAGLGSHFSLARLWKGFLVRRWAACRRTSWALPSGSFRTSRNQSRRCCWVSARRSCCQTRKDWGSKGCARAIEGSWAVSRKATAWACGPASVRTMAGHRVRSWRRPSVARPSAVSRTGCRNRMAQSRPVCR
jgi:hypothetical protein